MTVGKSRTALIIAPMLALNGACTKWQKFGQAKTDDKYRVAGSGTREEAIDECGIDGIPDTETYGNVGDEANIQWALDQQKMINDANGDSYKLNKLRKAYEKTDIRKIKELGFWMHNGNWAGSSQPYLIPTTAMGNSLGVQTIVCYQRAEKKKIDVEDPSEKAAALQAAIKDRHTKYGDLGQDILKKLSSKYPDRLKRNCAASSMAKMNGKACLDEPMFRGCIKDRNNLVDKNIETRLELSIYANDFKTADEVVAGQGTLCNFPEGD